MWYANDSATDRSSIASGWGGDALFAESWRANLGRHRSPYLFRGSSSHSPTEGE